MARGFLTGSSVLTHTADRVPLADIYNEIVTALDEWNKGRTAISTLFSSPTTDAFVLLAKNPEVGEDFEPQSEFGVPKSSRRDIEYFQMGLPLKFADIATRYTETFIRDATAEQLRLQVQSVMEKDNRRIFRETMKALTTKATAGNRDIAENTALEVYDLWDGSAGEVPPPYLGKTFSSSHNHYLVSGAANIDSGDVEALITTIQEHGYGLRASNERLVVMVHPDIADAIATWRAGVANANGATAKYDFIPSVGAPAYLSAEVVVGDKPPAEFNGLVVEGSYGDALIVKDYHVPSGYVLALATAGPNATRNPLAFREHTNPEWRGLLLRSHANHPLTNSYFQRGFRVGVRHRSAAAVMQIKANGSYENPTLP